MNASEVETMEWEDYLSEAEEAHNRAIDEALIEMAAWAAAEQAAHAETMTYDCEIPW